MGVLMNGGGRLPGNCLCTSTNFPAARGCGDNAMNNVNYACPSVKGLGRLFGEGIRFPPGNRSGRRETVNWSIDLKARSCMVEFRRLHVKHCQKEFLFSGCATANAAQRGKVYSRESHW